MIQTNKSFCSQEIPKEKINYNTKIILKSLLYIPEFYELNKEAINDSQP